MDQAEQLRNVIKLHNQNQTNTARVITVTSGKGGVGKSNVAVNLAIQLTKAGKKVLIFDADFGLANVEVMFGVAPKYNLFDVIYKGKSMKEIITPGPMGIGFISGGSGIVGLCNLYREQIMYLIRCLGELNDLVDFIIIDTGAGISPQVLEFVMASPEVLLITTPEPSSLTDSYSLLKVLYRNPKFTSGGTVVHVIANKVTSNEEGKQVFDKLNTVVSQFLNGSIDYLGTIPQDWQLEKAIRQQKTVSIQAPNSSATKAFEVLADNLLNGTHEQIQIGWGITQLFMKFFNRMN